MLRHAKALMMATLMICISTELAATESAQEKSFKIDLYTATYFFFPRSPLESFMSNACTEVLKTRLSTFPEEMKIEQKIPGIHKEMIQVAGNYCGTHIGPVLDKMQAAASSRVGKAFTVSEIKQLSNSFRSVIDDLSKQKFDVKEGETASLAAERNILTMKIDEAEIERATEALDRSPGGSALLDKAISFRPANDAAMQSDMAALFKPLLDELMITARRAANEYAQDRGYPAVYVLD
jgi:hypothetical protein